MPESAFAAAFEANGLNRDGMYVPNRGGDGRTPNAPALAFGLDI